MGQPTGNRKTDFRAEPPMRSATQVAGRRVTVMGLGRFGGGVGVTRWLVAKGAQVTVTDRADASALAASVARIDDLDVELALGGHPDGLLDRTDLLIVSPAVDKTRSTYFRAAAVRGIPWSSEMNLFLERCPGRIVGVTGSAGKSTTTAMIGEVLRAGRRADARRVHVGGNIGKSLLGELAEMKPGDTVVVELSSFQLEDLAATEARIDVAVMTNLSPNHLDRHGTMERYADAKLNVVRRLWPGGSVIHNVDDATLQHYLRPVLDARDDRLRELTVSAAGEHANIQLRDGTILAVESKPPAQARGPGNEPAAATCIARVDELPVPGLHNVYNAMGAAAVGIAEHESPDHIRTGLRRFQGLPHRLERVADVNGVGYYNDSKSTTPEATRVALAAFTQPVIMIVGGDDKKQSDFTELGRQLATGAKAVMCMGKTRAALHGAVADARGPSAEPILQHADDLQDAVQQAAGLAAPGDAIVLSPACASYDMFANYEERGDAFRTIARSMRSG